RLDAGLEDVRRWLSSRRLEPLAVAESERELPLSAAEREAFFDGALLQPVRVVSTDLPDPIADLLLRERRQVLVLPGGRARGVELERAGNIGAVDGEQVEAAVAGELRFARPAGADVSSARQQVVEESLGVGVPERRRDDRERHGDRDGVL